MSIRQTSFSLTNQERFNSGLKFLLPPVSSAPPIRTTKSTDSVFSRNEGETIDEYGHENEPVTPRPSLPIGTGLHGPLSSSSRYFVWSVEPYGKA